MVVGCSSTPKPIAWNVIIKKETPASIEADLLGVANESEEKKCEALTWDKYWSPDSPFRKDAEKLHNRLTHFLDEKNDWVITVGDAQWKTWMDRGVYELYLMARLPSPATDMSWRIPIKLYKGVWETKDKTLVIKIVDSEISIQTKAKR